MHGMHSEDLASRRRSLNANSYESTVPNVLIDHMQGHLAPTKAGSEEGVLSTHICKPPRLRGQHAKVSTAGQWCRIGQNELDVFDDFGLRHNLAVRGKRVRGRHDAHERDLEQGARLQLLRDGRQRADDTDTANDNKECTDDSCSNGTPVFTPKASGVACTQGGGHFCDGAGHCVECLAATDCPSLVCSPNHTCAAATWSRS